MDRKSQEEGWRKFLNLCSKADDEAKCQHLFDLFFTLEEKEMLAKRAFIIEALLDEKLTQREIAETYHVSIAQITRGSNALKIIDDKFRNFLKKLMK